jgi:electron transfer flavoprotein alpha subunit
MSILIYAESAEENSKVALSWLHMQKKVAEQGTTVTALTINAGDVSELSKYGVDKVLKVTMINLLALQQKHMLM